MAVAAERGIGNSDVLVEAGRHAGRCARARPTTMAVPVVTPLSASSMAVTAVSGAGGDAGECRTVCSERFVRPQRHDLP